MATITFGIMMLLIISTYHLTLATDEDPLQDFCVANQRISGTTINGLTCKDPTKVTASDFVSTLLRKAGIFNKLGSAFNPANVETFPGLNTLGISLVRIDFVMGGINPPHTHPRATEVLYVVEGTLNAGFISGSGTNTTLFTNMLYKGDVFVFPRGLIHFQENVGNSTACAIAALSSQLPGAQIVAPTLFGAKPAIPSKVLQLAFSLSAEQVAKLQTIFSA